MTALTAQPAQKGDAILTGQSQIQQHQIKGRTGQCLLGVQPVGHPIHVEAFAAEGDLNRVSDQRIVFDQQYTHLT